MHDRPLLPLVLFSLFGAAALGACGSSSGASPRTVDHWMGDTTHLAISGTYQDLTFDVRLEGPNSGIYCNRFYAPLPGTQPNADGSYDTAKLYFVMKELGGIVEVGGERKEFTVAYWRHDLPAGGKLTIVPRTFGTAIPQGNTWSDINIFEPGADFLSGIESAAISGTVSMELNTGTPDAGGIFIPSGVRTGEFISASWGPHDNLNVSATSDCNPAIVGAWAQSRVSP